MQRRPQVGVESFLAGNSSSSSPGYCSDVDARNSSGHAQAYQHCICMASTVVTEWGCVTSLATNGSVVYAGTQKGTILMYEKGPPNCQLVPLAQITCCGPVKALVVQENRAYTAHHDNKVRVWREQPRLKLLKTLPTVKDRIQKWINSSNNHFVQTKRRLHSRKRLWIEHFDAVTCLVLCAEEDPVEDILYSGSWDKTVKVWRLSDFRCLESINAHDDAVNAVTSARNGILFTGSADGSIKVWKRTPRSSLPASTRPQHHQHITTLDSRSHGLHVDDGSSAVNCLALSPDESILYSGTSKGEIKYWRMDKGSLHICYEDALCGHTRSVLCLTTLRQFVCSGSADTTIRVWVREAASNGSPSFHHSCLQVLEGHRGPVKAITAVSSGPGPELISSFSTSFSSSSSFPSNGTSSSSHSHYHNMMSDRFLVYSGSLDGTIKLWWVSQGWQGR